jgi:cation:H+ antiporter
MFVNILLLVFGFIILIMGANWMVSGATALAKKYNVSDLAIGLTIVAFGTSAPELVVNAISSYQNFPDLVFGNVIGSNNFNLFIILGIAGLITPLVVQSSTVWKEIPISFLAIVVFFLLANNFFVSLDYFCCTYTSSSKTMQNPK